MKKNGTNTIFEIKDGNCAMEAVQTCFQVIMPCYNSEKWVENAIKSIRCQTYPNWKLLVINDGSKDGTLSIVNSYAENDHRISVFSKENGGYSSAVNAGLDRVSEDGYFLLLGSDDRLAPELFEVLHNNISQLSYMPDCIAFRTRKVIDDVVKETDIYTAFDSVCAEKNTTFDRFCKTYPAHSAIFFARDTSKCFKAALLGDLRYFGKYGLDADGIFSMLFCHKGTSFLSVPYDGYYWSLHDDSLSASVSLEKLLDRIDNWPLFFASLLKDKTVELTDVEKDYIIEYYKKLVRFSRSIKYSIQYHGFIKKHAKIAKHLATTYYPNQIGTSMKMVAFSPLVYSLYNKIRSIFRYIKSFCK